MTTDSGSTLSDGLGGAEPMIAPRAAAVPGSTIMLKRTADLGKVPQAVNMADGEVFLNINTESAALFVKGSGGEVRSLGGVQVSANAPASPVEGLLWWDSTNEILKLYTGGFFINLSDRSSGTDMTLQAVTDNGNTTTNGAEFGGSVSADDFFVKDGSSIKGYLQADSSRVWMAGDVGVPICFDTNASERMRIDATGDVSIGGTLPASPNIELNADGEILVGSAGDQQVRVASVGSGVNARAIVTSRNSSSTDGGLNAFNVEKNSVETMRICVDGTTKIGGIPNTSPSITLKANGSGTFGSGNIALDADGSASFADGNLTVGSNGRLECFEQNRVTSTHGYLARGTGVWPTSFAFRSYNDGVETIVMGSGGNAWFADNVVIGGSNAFAAPNITLNADGTGLFAGYLRSGGNPNNGSANGAELKAGGRVLACSNGTNNVFQGYDQGNTTPTSGIFADGSADFAGGDITLNANGSLILKGPGAGDSIDLRNGSTWAWQGVQSGTRTSGIKWDGSAQFVSGSINFENNGANKGTAAIRQDEASFDALVVYKDGTAVSNKTAVISGDGSATFASQVWSGANPFAGAGTGSKLTDVGLVAASATPSSNPVWLGFTTGTSAETSRIGADGSGTFAGVLKVGDYNAGTGTAVFANPAGSVGIRPASTNADNVLSVIPTDNAATTASIRADGSATFLAGLITSTQLLTGGVPKAGRWDVFDTENNRNVYLGRSNTTPQHPGGVQSGFQVWDAGNLKTLAGIYYDGSATFASGDISLNADGSASFAGNVTAANINAFRSNGESIDMMATLEKMALKLAELGANTADLFVAAPEAVAPVVDESEEDEADS